MAQALTDLLAIGYRKYLNQNPSDFDSLRLPQDPKGEGIRVVNTKNKTPEQLIKSPKNVFFDTKIGKYDTLRGPNFDKKC